MNREERISYYERILDRVNLAAAKMESALDDYETIQDDLQVLEKYYCGREWTEDYEAEEAGLIPADLKRGVLSQDGIDHALERCRDLSDRIRRLKE